MRNPPTIPQWILNRGNREHNRSTILGDFEEFYHEIITESGKLSADFWYWKQALKSLPVFIKTSLYWRTAMFKNYVKVAIRSILNQKIYSFINIFGLAMGLAVFTLLAVIAGFNTEADKFHENYNRIYSVVQVKQSIQEGEEHSALLPAPFLPAITEEFPEIEKSTRAFRAGQMIVKKDEHIFYENRILFADPDFLSIFTYPLTAGNPATALKAPNSILLSDKMAQKYFGDINPIGQVLMLDNKVTVTVTGVLDHISDDYASIYFEFLVSMETARQLVPWMDDWDSDKQGTFLLLKKDADPVRMETNLPSIIQKYFDDSPVAPLRLYLLPLKDFRLHSGHITSFWHTNDYFLNYILMITGFLILIIVSINFINLSTARYMNRMKEVGIRKVVGAQRIQLVRQFLSESVIMALIAMPLSLVLYSAIFQFIMRFIVQYEGQYSILNHPFLYKYLVLVSLIVGLVSGLYPALFLTSFRPASILKGQSLKGKKGSLIRKILVISQFALAIILISLTLSWKQQHEHFLTAEYGYKRDHVVTVKLPEPVREQYDVMKSNLLQNADIQSISIMNRYPDGWTNEEFIIPEGFSKEEALKTYVYSVGYDIHKTLNIHLEKGRDFTERQDRSDSFIINDRLAEQLKWDNPLGKQLTVNGKTGPIIGVSKYYHFTRLTSPAGPAVFHLNPDNCSRMMILYSPFAKSEDINRLVREQWISIAPDLPFESSTLQKLFDESFRGDITFMIIFTFIDVVAICISCLGLFGLAAFAVQKRTKEIGIRKTLGASVSGIVQLLLKDFMILVIIANVFGIPAGYYISKAIFQYRTPHFTIPLGAYIFILTMAITVIAAVVAVVSQTLKAAQSNPVDTLRYE